MSCYPWLVSTERQQLEDAIAALEAQRALLGDAVVETALAPMRRELAATGSPESAAHQQLKQVSVLFVDVVESTAMGQLLNPEEIHAVIDGALERFAAVVQSHYGRVLKYTGDGMLAVFGSELAREDDVEGAVCAGLGIIEEAQRQAPQVQQKHGLPNFNVRAGVHTGTVLLGGGVDADGSIHGATVNIAARMEQSAPPGRLRISHDCYRHVHGLFDVVEQPSISVKGVEQPLRSYLVERVRPRPFRVATRGIEGVDSRMVGREAELAALRAALGTVVAARRAQAIIVVGDAGLGKSRLLAEFQQTLDLQSCMLLLGRAHPRSTLEPFGLLRDMLARHLQIGESEPASEARRKLVDELAPLFVDEGEAPIHLLGHLIGYDFSTSAHLKDLLGNQEAFRQRAFEATAMCMRRLGQTRAVVLVLDDLHWADAGSLAFVRHLLRANQDTPLLSLMLTRQTLFDQLGDWHDTDLPHTRVDLRPLDKAHSRELADTLLQRIGEVPAALRALVISGAEGNPFYMEELVKMFIDDGVIRAEPGGWQVLPDKLLGARVPSTLTGVLQARLDALASRERTALQQAAIVGHVFWDRALAAIDPAAIDALPALLRKQMIVRRDAPAVDNTHEYVFQHHLLHQVTYDSVLKEPKHAGHARAGAFWSRRAEVASPQEVDPAKCRALAEVQYHRGLSDAKDYVAWFDNQFAHYINAYAAPTLQPLAEQLIEVCERQFGADQPATAKALTNLARVIRQTGVGQAEPLLRRAISIQEHSLEPDHADAVLTLAVLGMYYEGRGDWRAAEPLLRRALDIRQRVLGSDHPLTLSAMDHLGKVMVELDRLDEAEALFRQVLRASERRHGREHPDTAFALTALGEVLAKKGDFDAAESLIRRALAVQQEHLSPDHPDTGLSMWHLAETLRGLGRCDEAEPLARRTLDMWERTFGAEHEWTAWALISLSKIRLAQGDAGEAASLAGRAAQILKLVFGPEHAEVGSTLNLQASALMASGKPAVAEPPRSN